MVPWSWTGSIANITDFLLYLADENLFRRTKQQFSDWRLIWPNNFRMNMYIKNAFFCSNMYLRLNMSFLFNLANFWFEFSGKTIRSVGNTTEAYIACVVCATVYINPGPLAYYTFWSVIRDKFEINPRDSQVWNGNTVSVRFDIFVSDILLCLCPKLVWWMSFKVLKLFNYGLYRLE